MFRSILFPITTNPETFEAAVHAIKLSKLYGSQLIILSVRQNKNSQMNNFNANSLIIEQIKKEIQKTTLTYKVISKEGSMVTVICDTAKRLNIDLIVLQAKGLNLNTNRQSQSFRIIELAPCPVYVLP